MASEDHLSLADFIKSVHQTLREKAQALGVEQAWENHCADEENLKRYADAMKELATNHWERNEVLQSNVVSRIEWTVNICRNYFMHEIIRCRDRENEIATKINLKLPTTDLYTKNPIDKLKLLDVGSCYNPFKKFDCFNVTAIDIAPALDDVFKCDFLNLKMADSTVINNQEVRQLQKHYFDIVVFCLLLEYLPSPRQRLACCEKAYGLLKTEGLLIIITPDSNHVGTNAKYMKSWRFVLAEIGFSRIKYEKLPHLHCMAFRKAYSKELTIRWAALHKAEQVFSEIFIPQDFKEIKERISDVKKNENNCLQDYKELINELPNCDIFQ